MNFNVGPEAADEMAVVVIAFLIATAVVHCLFAAGVYRDAARRVAAPEFGPAWLWTLATLLGGVPIAAIYWAMHYSTLRRPGGTDSRATDQ